MLRAITAYYNSRGNASDIYDMFDDDLSIDLQKISNYLKMITERFNDKRLPLNEIRGSLLINNHCKNLTIIYFFGNTDKYCHSGFVRANHSYDSAQLNTGIYDFRTSVQLQVLWYYQVFRFLHPLEDSFRRNDNSDMCITVSKNGL